MSQIATNAEEFYQSGVGTATVTPAAAAVCKPLPRPVRWLRLREEPSQATRGLSVFFGWWRASSVPARQVYLTPEGLKQLQGELDHLKTAKRREVAKRIHDASQGGGTVDNAEYDEAKNEQAFTEGRIRELESLLSNAVVAKSGERKRARKKSVEFGSSITVKTASGDKKAYKLVGSAEAAPLEGKISNESPVGSALIGHLVGDTVEVETPSGVMELTITRIG